MAEKIVFESEEGSAEFFVLEQTRLNGCDYLLVEEGGNEGECLILKDISNPEDEEAEYVIVEDETEQEALVRVFEELLEDTEIE